ncbi:MAG: nucleotidyl transferase AbiEii/AbiGii toxin family protein [Sedimentisphaerales bacterium]|nr:nucleotidyl transferase AbiEii/AbiGii toxin family protein [Sedimentisphaerales bacterium]MBN2841516.1 nucleotidyl transferase AbiEii/AbiGii toxin family protein [Sedimentisphaerales bacterium]
MNKPNIAKSVHQRLINLRDKTGQDFNVILTRYGLERILYRIMISGHADVFVLKGAMLFQLWHNVPGRPTRDLDMLGYEIVSHEQLRQIFTDACNVTFEEDGLSFDSESIQTQDIRDDQEYHGIRTRFIGYLNTARIALQIDIGFGDAIIPWPDKIEYPTLLDLPAPKIKAYHPATVIAEKINAMVVLGYMNSRMKDFYDVYILLSNMEIDDKLLWLAIKATFDRRKTAMPEQMPVAFTGEFLEDTGKQKQWFAFLNRSKLSDSHLTLSQAGTYIASRIWPIMQQP